MKKFIPAEKMSKKARAALARQQRTVWPCCPVGRKLENGKIYNRKKISHARFDGDGMGFFVRRSERCLLLRRMEKAQKKLFNSRDI